MRISVKSHVILFIPDRRRPKNNFNFLSLICPLTLYASTKNIIAMGSSSSTLRHSGWVDQELCGCGCEYRAFEMSWQEHAMVGEAAEFGINTGRVAVGIATLGISTWFNGGIKAPLHDAVTVFFVCDGCGKSFARTYEFGPTGKRDNWGRYAYYRNVRDHRSVNVPIRVMNEIFRGMHGRGSYDAVDYNCSHWAGDFFYKVP